MSALVLPCLMACKPMHFLIDLLITMTWSTFVEKITFTDYEASLTFGLVLTFIYLKPWCWLLIYLNQDLTCATLFHPISVSIQEFLRATLVVYLNSARISDHTFYPITAATSRRFFFMEIAQLFVFVVYRLLSLSIICWFPEDFSLRLQYCC